MKKMSAVLRRPPVILLLAVQLLVVLSAVWSAARPAAVYRFTPDQWEEIAEHSEIAYDAEGRRGVTEMTDGEAILQTPAMSLPAGHYRVTLEYEYQPGLTTEGLERHATLYFTSDEALTVTGERAWITVDRQQDTVVLNVRYASDTVRLVAANDGGIFTIGEAEIRQDMRYAWACVPGWAVLFGLLDLALLLLLPGSPRRLRDDELRGCLWLLAGAVLLVCVPLLMDGGGMQGDDWRFHLSRIEGIAQGLREGQFPVRIYSQAKSGYGYAPSLFYGELLLYFPAVLRLLGMSVQGAYRAYAMAIQALTAGLAFYSFRQMFRHNKTALLGSILYIMVPYHLYHLYVRSAVGEYTAFAFLPLIPAALCRLYGGQVPDQRQRKTACRELVVAFGALVQTHILSLEMVSIATAAFCLYHWRKTFRRQVLAVWGTAAGVVVLLNLWFLVPFATVMLSGEYSRTHGALDYSNGLAVQVNGLNLSELLAGRSDGNGIGLALLAGAALFVGCRLSRGREMSPRERTIGTCALLLGGIACWMSTDTFPWYRVGGIPGVALLLLTIQFPWRYLSLATILLLLAGLCAVSALRRGPYARSAAVLLLSVSVAGLANFYGGYLPDQQESYLGDRGQLLYADARISNLTWYYDTLYLPEGAYETADGFMPAAAVTSVEIASLEQSQGVTTLVCQETAGQTGHAELPLLYYPGYTVLRGEGEIFRTVNGMVGVAVPAGYAGEAQVAFREPVRWLLADLVSLLTALVLLGRMAVLPVRRRGGKER